MPFYLQDPGFPVDGRCLCGIERTESPPEHHDRRQSARRLLPEIQEFGVFRQLPAQCRFCLCRGPTPFRSSRTHRKAAVHPDYLPKVENADKLVCDLFEYHGISQSSDNMPDLAFLFTTDELYDFWQLNNFEWYYEQGPSPLSGGHMPNLACNLLRNIVEAADTALASARPCATLRFGHDTNLAPLVALMQIEDFNHATADWDSIPEYYQTYRMIPMCGNLQLVFFRKQGSTDILVKLLLNEREFV